MYSAEQFLEVFKKYKTDKEIHRYQDVYKDVFTTYPESILEIGVKTGASLLAWKDLFKDSSIYGIDITKKFISPKLVNNSDFNIRIGDSTDRKFTRTIEEKFSYIIDDGSHFYLDILQTFNNFKNKFIEKYVIEDVYDKLDYIKKYIESTGLKVQVYKSKRYRYMGIKSDIIDYGFYDKNKTYADSEYVTIPCVYILVVTK